MGVSLQIALGLVPVIILCALLAVFRRQGRARNIILAAVMFISAAAICIVNPFHQPAAETSPAASAEELQLVYSMADAGSPDLARTALDELMARSEYKPAYTLCAARLYAAEGEYELADALYTKAEASTADASAEHAALQQVMQARTGYMSAADSVGRRTAYASLSDLQKDHQKTLENAFQGMSSADGKEVWSRAGKFVVFAGQAHATYLQNGTIDTGEVEKELRKVNSLLEENPVLQQVPQMRLARLKLQLLCEDYKDIAACADAHSDYNELLIVSELYLDGYVKKSDFKEDFGKNSVKKYEAVKDQLDYIYSHSYQNKPREERNDAKDTLNGLTAVIRNPALSNIETHLLTYAQSGNAMDASKVYLQLAKIAHSVGNDPKFNTYMDRSLDTVGDCEDGAYTAPMYELIGIINDKDDPEKLKGAAQYVDDVLSNNMTVKMVEPQQTDQSGNSGATAESGLVGDISSQVQTYVSQKRMSVKIVKVDASGFNQDGTVRATVNISNNLYNSADELKAALAVKDCGANITDFTLNKVQYTGANILLCVDVSGSMDGMPIENLRNAVKMFVESKADIENISLVAFTDGINAEYPFGTSSDDLLNAASNLYADGGTNMYGALINAIGKFQVKPGEINSIILMSDGQDNNPANITQIEEEIVKPARDKGITIYSIGFGNDADARYLNSFASETGGSYLYADDPTANAQVNQLSEFFDGLRAQILNQYTVTFKAANTINTDRELKVSVGAGLDYDTYRYYINGASADQTGNAADSKVYMQGKAVYGLDKKLLLKSNKSTVDNLKGDGFTDKDEVSVKLVGDTNRMEIELESKYKDANTIELTVPGGIGADTYDVYVDINGKEAVLDNGLSVYLQGSEQRTVFGPYVFTSYHKSEDHAADTTTLDGFVTLNGWLRFNGAVTLTGRLTDGSIIMSDQDGSYVQYFEGNSEGLAGWLAQRGWTVPILPLLDLKLYDDTLHEVSSDDYTVDKGLIDGINVGLMKIGTPGVRLYPDRLQFDLASIQPEFPFAEKVMTHTGDLFYFQVNGSASLSSNSIGITVNGKFKAGEGAYENINLGKIPVSLMPSEVELKINTCTNEYEFTYKADLPFLGMKEVGFTINCDDLKLNKLAFSADPKNPPTIDVGGVPISFSDFSLGVEDIADKPMSEWTYTGGCDIGAYQISAIPGLDELTQYIGDVSLLSLDDARLSFRPSDQWFVKLSTGAKLLDFLDLGNLEIEFGNLKYTNALLNMSNRPVQGLRAKTELKLPWNVNDNTKIELDGSAELSAHSLFCGLTVSGTATGELRWGVFHFTETVQGTALVGIRLGANGQTFFTFRTNPGGNVFNCPSNVSG